MKAPIPCRLQQVASRPGQSVAPAGVRQRRHAPGVESPQHGSDERSRGSGQSSRSAHATVNLQAGRPKPPALCPVVGRGAAGRPRTVAAPNSIAATARATGEQPSRPCGAEIEPRPPRDLGRGLPDEPTDAPTCTDRRSAAITIGRVTIEIVPATDPAAASPRPLTAAAASLIGPLGSAHDGAAAVALRRL